MARDLKALGLYIARSLSFEGILYEIVEHALTPEQIAIYDAYADAFQIIHKNLKAALEAATSPAPTAAPTTARPRPPRARRSNRNKLRFFNHLLAAMKCPTLIAALNARLERAMPRSCRSSRPTRPCWSAASPRSRASEWGDLSIDITPREYVLDYLKHSFPTQLFELYTDEEGNLHSRPVTDADGNPVQSREAVERRDRMIEHLASLPPVQGALDQILHRFGTEMVAEVTGRSRRIVKKAARTGPALRRDPARFGEFRRDLRLHG